MKLYINDLSFLPQAVIPNHDNLIRDLIDVCSRIKKYKFEKIVMPDNFKVKEICQYLTLISYRDDASKNIDIRRRLKSIISNQMVKISTDENDDSIQYVELNKKDSEFLKKSFNQNLPIISLRTDIKFDDNVLKIQNKYFDESELEIIEQGEIVNLSHENHFIIHASFLNQKLLENTKLDGKWNPKQNPLRFKDLINQYLQDIDYEKKLKSKDNSSYKMALYLEVGSRIAEMNGWDHDKYLSTINSNSHKKRKIFKSRNRTFYLSIDVQHGAFELLDRRGKHITEYNFKGKDMGKTYDDGSHDIKI